MMDATHSSIAGIFLALVVMIVFAFRGYPMLLIAPLCSAMVCFLSGEAVMEVMSGPYMASFAGFLQNYFFLFLASSVFGRLISDSGAAKTIAYRVASVARAFPGKEKVMGVLALVAIQSILTLGGISVFVLVFTMASLGKNLLEELDIPWTMYGCTNLGSGCFTMTMVPGTPSIHNLIPIRYLGTTPAAAPVIGLVCSGIALGLGITFITYKIARHNRKGDGFLPSGTAIALAVASDQDVPHLNLAKCLFPSVVLLVVMNVFKQDPVAALTCACFTTIVLFRKRLTDLKAGLTAAAVNAATPLINTCALIGFGGVVAAMPSYGVLIGALDKIPGPPIVQLVVAVNLVSGLTGSASGGIGIAMETLSQRFLAMGLHPEVIHRIGVMSASGLDALPHNPGMNNILQVSRLGFGEGYRNHIAVTAAIPMIVTAVGATLAQFGVR